MQGTKTIKANWGETSHNYESHKSNPHLKRSSWQKTSKEDATTINNTQPHTTQIEAAYLLRRTYQNWL